MSALRGCVSPLLVVVTLAIQLVVVRNSAAQVIFSSKVTGDMVAAQCDLGASGGVNVTPVDTDDDRLYSVFWRGCTLSPDFDHRLCMFAAGLVPRSVVKVQQGGTLALDLDISDLTFVFAIGGEDCRSGICIPFVPASIPLNGTFTIYRGSGSYLEQSNGSSRRDDIVVLGNLTTTASQSFVGTFSRYSATFSGQVGPVVAFPGLVGPNALLTFLKGQQSYEVVSAPTP